MVQFAKTYLRTLPMSPLSIANKYFFSSIDSDFGRFGIIKDFLVIFASTSIYKGVREN
jgi:hypothetical protein